MEVALRWEWPVLSGRREDHVLAAGDARIRGVLGTVRRVDRRHHLEAPLDQLARPRRVHLQARRFGGQDRVEVAAEGHVVAEHLTIEIDRAVSRQKERGHVA